jgi:hypothetical protein
MGTPSVAPEGLTTRFKRWLRTERVEHLDATCEPSDEEERPPHDGTGERSMPTHGPEVAVRGEIRREEIPLLARYGTSYALFDAWIADY